MSQSRQLILKRVGTKLPLRPEKGTLSFKNKKKRSAGAHPYYQQQSFAYLYNFMAKEEENKAILVHWRRRLMSTASGGPRFWATVNLMEVWQLLPIGHNGHSPVCEIAIAKKRRVAKTPREAQFWSKNCSTHSADFQPFYLSETKHTPFL